MMIRWVLGLSELIISLASFVGLSLIGKSPQQFCIEQFIILSPHVINYACSVILAENYIAHQNRVNLRYKRMFIKLSIDVGLVFFISLLGLFVAISGKVILSGGSMIVADYVTVSSRHVFPVSLILLFDFCSLYAMDAYSINTSVNNYNNIRR